MAEVSKEYLKELAARARAGLARVKDEQREALDHVKRIVEVGFGSFAIGWYHGRQGAMPTYFSVPLDALAGGALLAIGMMKFQGSQDVFNVGLGVFGYWCGNLGASLGQKMRKATPDWKGAPYPANEQGYALGPDGKPMALQVRTITAGMPQYAPQHAVPAYGYAPPTY